MKILFNCLNLEKGGTQRVISILANYFIKDNEVAILLLRNKKIKYKIDPKIKILIVDQAKNLLSQKLAKISLFKLRKMAKKIKDYQPDIIISFLPEPSLKLMLLKKMDSKIKNIPTIVSIRNDPQKEYHNKLIYYVMKSLYQNVDKLVLQTKDAYNYFQKILSEDKLVIIPNPIDSKIMIDKPYPSSKKNIIVTVGRLEKQKNQQLLITAFLKVSLQYPKLKLLIYGSGKLEKKLKRYVKDLNLEKKVIFKGEVMDIASEIYQAKMFVLSSNYEGMPNALMEAMALGLPCIATDCPCGGPKMLIKNNYNGILVPTHNSEALAKAILKLLEDKKISKEISQHAFHESKKYTLNNIAQLWEEEIKKLI